EGKADEAGSPRAHPPTNVAGLQMSPFTRRELMSSPQIDSTDLSLSVNDTAPTDDFSLRASKRTSSGTLKTPSSSLPSSPQKESRNSPSLDNEKIQEISSNLRTRLSYAMLKVQNGWTTRSLEEIEQKVKEPSSQNSPGTEFSRPDYPHRISISPSLAASSQLYHLSRSDKAADSVIAATHVIIDTDREGRLSTTTAITTTGPAPNSSTLTRHVNTTSKGSPTKGSSSIYSHPISRSYSSVSPSRSISPDVVQSGDHILKKELYSPSHRQQEASGSPTQSATSIVSVPHTPTRMRTTKSKGGVPITPEGLPVLGTFSNKIPPSLARFSPSPSKRKGKTNSGSHSTQNYDRSDRIHTGTSAVVAAAAAAAAELEKEEKQRMGYQKDNTSRLGNNAKQRQISEAEAIESLMFLSSPTTRSWSESER
ncbi:hypothetical protein V1511DRAFT_447377, partial [Dipodascopsis uninucleata]